MTWPSLLDLKTQISSLLCPSLPQGDSTNDSSCGLWLLITSSGWDVSNTVSPSRWAHTFCLNIIWASWLMRLNLFELCELVLTVYTVWGILKLLKLKQKNDVMIWFPVSLGGLLKAGLSHQRQCFHSFTKAVFLHRFHVWILACVTECPVPFLDVVLIYCALE